MRDEWMAAGVVLAGAYYAALRAALRLPRRRVFVDGDFASGIRWSRFAGVVLGRRYAHRFLIPALEYAGRTREAVALAESLSRGPLTVGETNACVNAFINAGRYRRAVEVAAPLEARGLADPEWPLVQVNVAEAEANLGDPAAALARLDRAARSPRFEGLSAAGAGQLKGWIFAHLGRPAEAHAALEAVRLSDVPRIFHAELHFARAAALLSAGEPAAALGALDLGRAVAVRASSVRNELFLRARCLAAAGDVDGALAAFAQGAEHAYVHQGGAALLAWGDLLEKHGRHAEARRAWQLAIERDAESEAASAAGNRPR